MTNIIQSCLPPSNLSFHNNLPHECHGHFQSTIPHSTFAHSGLRVEADTTARAEGYHHNSTYSDDEADGDYFPSVEELLQTPFFTKATTKPSKPERNRQHIDKPALDTIDIDHTKSMLGGGQGGSQDQPVIIEDDESDSTDTEEVETGTITGAGNESGSPGRDTSLHRTGSTKHPPSESTALNIWYNVEDGRYVGENEPSPSLGLRAQECSPSLACAQNRPSALSQSPKPPRDQTKQCITQRTSEQPAAYPSAEPPRQGGDGCGDDTVAELEEGGELAWEEQEKSSPTSSPRPSPCPIESSHDEINPGKGEERGDGSQLNTPDVSEEERVQQDAEIVVEETGEKQQYEEEETVGKEGQEEEELAGQEEELDEQVEVEAKADNTGDEDDEDIRPAKRRKLPLEFTDEALMPSLEHVSKHTLERPLNLTQISAAGLEMDDVQSQADHRCTSISIDDQHHCFPLASRSPSATAESVPAAEYREWPLHGFLKRTRIGDETTFNLQFHLTHLPEDVEVSTPSEALGSGFGVETSAQPRISHSAVAQPKTAHHVPSRPLRRVKWTAEEDATLVRMRGGGCSWEEISAALPSRNPGAIQVRCYTKFSNGGTGSRKRG